MATFFGYNAPFIGGSQKVVSRQEDERLVKNDLLQLLLTAPGERVMMPDFGSPIRRFLFDPLTEEDAAILEAGIKDAIEKYEPRVNATQVLILRNKTDDNLMGIQIIGTFNFGRGLQSEANLIFELNLQPRLK